MLSRAIATGLGASVAVVGLSQLAYAAKVDIVCFHIVKALDLSPWSQLYFACRILNLVAQSVSKASVLIFTRRIFSGDLNHEKICFQAAYALVALFGVSAVLLSSAGCQPKLALDATHDLVCSLNVSIRLARVLGARY